MELNSSYGTKTSRTKEGLVFASSDLTLPINLTVSQWELIDLLMGTLNIFNQATLAVSSSTVTVSKIIPIVNSVISELQMPSESGSGIVTARQSLLNAMNKRYRNIEEDKICSVATLLDPCLKGRVFHCPSALNAAKDRFLELANQHEGPASINEEKLAGLSAEEVSALHDCTEAELVNVNGELSTSCDSDPLLIQTVKREEVVSDEEFIQIDENNDIVTKNEPQDGMGLQRELEPTQLEPEPDQTENHGATKDKSPEDISNDPSGKEPVVEDMNILLKVSTSQLFGNSLVSKLKQKIQEKIKAVVEVQDPEGQNKPLLENMEVPDNEATIDRVQPKCENCKSSLANCKCENYSYLCEFCARKFSSKTSFLTHHHWHSMTKMRKRHKCDVCRRAFILKSSMLRHRQFHFGQQNVKSKKRTMLKQFPCTLCNKVFRNDMLLSFHKKIHIAAIDGNNMFEKQYEDENRTQKKKCCICVFCGEQFVDSRSLSVHSTLHSDPAFAAFDIKQRLLQEDAQEEQYLKEI